MKVNIDELEIGDYDILENIKTAFYRLWKKKLIVAVMMIVGFFLFFVYIGVVGIQTTYLSSASIYSAVYGSYEDSTYGITVMNQYVSMLGSTRVCERAANNLHDSDITAVQLRKWVANGDIYMSGASADSKAYAAKLTLVVNIDSSDHIVEITNAMAKAFADEINDLLGVSALQVMDESMDFVSYQSINTKLYLLLFVGGAFVITAAVIFIKEFFATKVYSISQCEQDKMFVLGMIPYDEKGM